MHERFTTHFCFRFNYDCLLVGWCPLDETNISIHEPMRRVISTLSLSLSNTQSDYFTCMVNLSYPSENTLTHEYVVTLPVESFLAECTKNTSCFHYGLQRDHVSSGIEEASFVCEAKTAEACVFQRRNLGD